VECLHLNLRLESGPVTADMKTTVVHCYNLLINEVKPVHSLTCHTGQLITYSKGH